MGAELNWHVYAFILLWKVLEASLHRFNLIVHVHCVDKLVFEMVWEKSCFFSKPEMGICPGWQFLACHTLDLEASHILGENKPKNIDNQNHSFHCLFFFNNNI